jgi:CBS domain-containing protein
MKIRDVLKLKNAGQANGRSVIAITPTSSLRDATKVLAKNKIGILVVQDRHEKMIGVLSERDVVHAIGTHGDQALDSIINTVMTKDIKTCASTDDPVDVMKMMTSGGFRHVPVVDDGKFIDLLSTRDVSKYITDFASPTEQAALWTKISWL